MIFINLIVKFLEFIASLGSTGCIMWFYEDVEVPEKLRK